MVDYCSIEVSWKQPTIQDYRAHLATCTQAGKPESDALLLEQLRAFCGINRAIVEGDVGGHGEDMSERGVVRG